MTILLMWMFTFTVFYIRFIKYVLSWLSRLCQGKVLWDWRPVLRDGPPCDFIIIIIIITLEGATCLGANHWL
jgi:hypothetical protein